MKPLGHSRGLDGVRGIAIIGVVGRHFFSLPGGSLGVDLFFVLSGFLITTLLLEERDRLRTIRLSVFYARRARRLLPALGVLLLLVALVGSLAYSPGRLVLLIGAAAFYFLNLLGVSGHRWVYAGTPINHLWTLSQEEQFYIVWPLLLLLALRRMEERRLLRFLFVTFAVLIAWRAALVAGGAGYDRIMFGPDVHSDGLVLGCAAALLRRRGIRVNSAVGVVAIVGLCASACWANGLGRYAIALPVFEICAAALVLASSRPGLLASLLGVWPLAWLGTISYSLYLWHEPARWLTAPWGGHPNWMGLSLAGALAIASFYGVERPFRRASRRMLQPEPVPALSA